MKHIEGEHEITSHKVYTCQGRLSHKSYHSPKAQTTIETGPTTNQRQLTCPTISVVSAHSMTFRVEHLNIKLHTGITQYLRQYIAWNTRPRLISGKQTPFGIASARNPNQMSIFMMPHDLSY